MTAHSDTLFTLESTLKRCKALEDFCRRGNKKEIKLDIKDFYNLMSRVQS